MNTEFTRIDHIDLLVKEYARGLLTGVEFLSQVGNQINEIEVLRNDR